VQTRKRRTRVRWAALGLGASGFAVAAALLFASTNTPPAERELLLSSNSVTSHQWGERVALDVVGTGEVMGTDDNLTVEWESGTLEASVVPHSGVAMSVRTDEALINVVGTVFSVTRDLLGTTVGVDEGRVQVSCEDGWTGILGAEETHICQPTSASGLLGRSEALIDAGAESAVLQDTLDRGIAVAADGAILGELLVRRMQLNADEGEVDDALHDAERYLRMDETARREQVQRFAGWLALGSKGCDAATPWLSALHESGSGPETVLLAECLSTTNPERARTLLVATLPTLDETWSDRAVRALSTLE
jgi:hypothetical protein